MRPLILASASPARAKLLSAAGVIFKVVPADVDEAVLKREAVAKGHTMAATACVLAAEKARSVARIHPDAIVLGADQILDLDGEIVSKSRNEDEALSLLRRLRGRTHELVTAAVLISDGNELWTRTEVCRMTMRRSSDLFLQDYLRGAGPALTRCVGCYELEGLGAQLFERMEGDFFSVLGLPLLPILAALRDQGAIAR